MSTEPKKACPLPEFIPDYSISEEYRGKTISVPKLDRTFQLDLDYYLLTKNELEEFIQGIRNYNKEGFSPEPDSEIILKIPKKAYYLDVDIFYEEDDDSGEQDNTTSQTLNYYSEAKELIDSQDLYNVEVTGILDRRLELIFVKNF